MSFVAVTCTHIYTKLTLCQMCHVCLAYRVNTIFGTDAILGETMDSILRNPLT